MLRHTVDGDLLLREQKLVKHFSGDVRDELKVEVGCVGADDRKTENVNERCSPERVGGLGQRSDGRS